eukprot:1851466-Prorocentrum_lima.AAC.1
MTSSLVGSEMCIRDSCRGQPFTAVFLAGALQGTKIGMHEVTTRRRLPVSYTHLTLPTICSV